MGATGYSATPTKVGEFLSCGRPVVVNAQLGDLDELLPRYDCGVVVADHSPGEIRRAADEIERLVGDPGTPARCRALAETHFDLDRAVEQLIATYRLAAG